MISTDQADEFWDDPLANIEERRVIPIVGPELLTVERGGTHVGFNPAVPIAWVCGNAPAPAKIRLFGNNGTTLSPPHMPIDCR